MEKISEGNLQRLGIIAFPVVRRRRKWKKLNKKKKKNRKEEEKEKKNKERMITREWKCDQSNE